MPDRRSDLPFDPRRFERAAAEGRRFTMDETFGRIHAENHWGGDESVSGAGSSTAQTRHLVAALPALLASVHTEVLLDLPCGAFGWIAPVADALPRYIGADVVPAIVEANRARHAAPHRRFEVLDLTRDVLPAADVMLCRDALVHLSFDDIRRAFDNLRHSAVRYLLTTTFPEAETNEDIVTGDWRVLNLERPPFDLPPPRRLLNEHCTESNGRYADKSLGLWAVEELPGRSVHELAT